MRVQPDIAMQHFLAAAEVCLDAGVQPREFEPALQRMLTEWHEKGGKEPVLARAAAVLDLAGIDRTHRRPDPPRKRIGCECGHPGLGCMC